MEREKLYEMMMIKTMIVVIGKNFLHIDGILYVPNAQLPLRLADWKHAQ